MKSYETYQSSNLEVSTAAAKLFTGRSKAEMFRLMEDIPTIDDVPASVSYLRSRRIRSTIATVTFDFASEWFATRFGFDGYGGIKLAYDKTGRLTGDVVEHVDELGKAEFIRTQQEAMGISPSETFYVGDSRSDIPTFRSVGYSVALNASSEAVAAASRSIRTRSLFEALHLIPGLLPHTLKGASEAGR